MSRIGDLLRQGLADRQTREDRAPVLSGKPAFDGKIVMHPSNMALLTYWQIAREDRPIAAWSQIDLLEISEHLQNLMMFEWNAPDAPICRFAGPNIVNWTGLEPTAMTIPDLLGANFCQSVAGPAEYLRQGERIALLQAKYQSKADRTILIEKLCLPLTDDRGNLRYLLVGNQWMSGEFAHGENEDTLDLKSITVTSKSLMPLETETGDLEEAKVIRRHPWVTRTNSVA